MQKQENKRLKNYVLWELYHKDSRNITCLKNSDLNQTQVKNVRHVYLSTESWRKDSKVRSSGGTLWEMCLRGPLSHNFPDALLWDSRNHPSLLFAPTLQEKAIKDQDGFGRHSTTVAGALKRKIDGELGPREDK